MHSILSVITQHVPEKSFQMVRYYGWHSNKSRGIRNKKGMGRTGDQPVEEVGNIEILDVSDYHPQRIPSKDCHPERIEGTCGLYTTHYFRSNF